VAKISFNFAYKRLLKKNTMLPDSNTDQLRRKQKTFFPLLFLNDVVVIYKQFYLQQITFMVYYHPLKIPAGGSAGNLQSTSWFHHYWLIE
tara:strand:+ start:1611 stop:1880 length:270 start_codon:yes stop_codon:yes gene_type:complete